ncbi:MAG: restriction endonuclease subunit S, partial [Eubacteriales bacterium]
ITNFCEINPSTSYQKEVEQISFLPMECISDIYGEIIELRDGEKGKSKGYTRFQENDVLWAKITPCMQNGKSVIAKNLKNGYGYGSTEYHVFRAKEDKVIPEFLYCFLRTKAVRELAKVYFTGSAGQQRVGADFLEALTLPNIPIKSDDKSILTQQIIVDKIFDMKSKIKELKTKSSNLRHKAKKEFEEDIFDE